MNSKPSNAINLVLILGVLIALTVWWKTNRQDAIEATAQESASKTSKKTIKRRTRVGPRTPPTTANFQTDSKDNDNNLSKDNSTEPVSSEEVELHQQEEKLADYLEHLDVLDNPNVDELTMLGEMAFDANESEAAYEHYLEVIDHHTDHPLAPFALYKLAWAEYNLGDVEAAIADMELMLEWLEVGESPMAEILRAAGPSDLAKFAAEKK